MLKEDRETGMDELIQKFKAQGIKGEVQGITAQGSPSAVIKEFAEREGIELIVMGTTGKGRLEGTVLGSTAFNVSRNVTIPLILVPGSCDELVFDQIVYAADLNFSASLESMKPLLTLAKQFDGSLEVLHIQRSKDKQVDLEALKLDVLFRGIEVKFSIVESEDIAQGILDHLNYEGDDIVCILTQERNALSRLFHRSVSKGVASKASIPVLLLGPQ